MQSERRGAPRACVDLPLRVSTAAEARPARLKNISQTGLCCQLDHAVDEMAIMGIDLELPDVGTQSVQGVVVRCDRDEKSAPPGYEIAIYFTELAPDARRAIQEFVQSRL